MQQKSGVVFLAWLSVFVRARVQILVLLLLFTSYYAWNLNDIFKLDSSRLYRSKSTELARRKNTILRQICEGCYDETKDRRVMENLSPTSENISWSGLSVKLLRHRSAARVKEIVGSIEWAEEENIVFLLEEATR